MTYDRDDPALRDNAREARSIAREDDDYTPPDSVRGDEPECLPATCADCDSAPIAGLDKCADCLDEVG